jgi:hypothetical protein
MKKSLKNRVIPFDFKPFSPKQQMVLSWWTDNSPYKDKDVIVCDGAVRSGKTVSMALSFVMWAMEHFNGYNFALCGKTVGSLRRNVLGPLKQMLLSRKYRMEDGRTDGYVAISRTIIAPAPEYPIPSTLSS